MINIQYTPPTPPTVPLHGNACTTHRLKPEDGDSVMIISLCVVTWVCVCQNYIG